MENRIIRYLAFSSYLIIDIKWKKKWNSEGKLRVEWKQIIFRKTVMNIKIYTDTSKLSQTRQLKTLCRFCRLYQMNLKSFSNLLIHKMIVKK